MTNKMLIAEGRLAPMIRLGRRLIANLGSEPKGATLYVRFDVATKFGALWCEYNQPNGAVEDQMLYALRCRGQAPFLMHSLTGPECPR